MMNQKAEYYRGHCHCKKISFECSSSPIVHIACHCQDCRQATGDDYSTIAFFKKADFYKTGDSRLEEFVADNGSKTHREYCEVCGTVMFDQSAGFPNLIGVFSKEIKSPKIVNPKLHVWVSSKLSDVTLPHDVEAFKKGLPAKK